MNARWKKRKPQRMTPTKRKIAQLEGDLRLARAAHQSELARRTALEAKLQQLGETLAPFIDPYLGSGGGM